MCIVPKTPANFCFLIWFWKLLNNWIIGWLVKTCRQIRSHSFCADYRYFIRLSTNRLLITHTIINWISFSESLLKQKSQLRKCQTFTAVNGCHKCCIYGTWRAPHNSYVWAQRLNTISNLFLFFICFLRCALNETKRYLKKAKLHFTIRLLCKTNKNIVGSTFEKEVKGMIDGWVIVFGTPLISYMSPILVFSATNRRPNS